MPHTECRSRNAEGRVLHSASGVSPSRDRHGFFLEEKDLRLVLFGGKGGVGKTTCATAAALHFARSSPQSPFLLVSTDPAHSLADSLADFLPPANLEILEFNAQECLDAFKAKHREKIREIASRGSFLDEEDISQLLDLSLPGLDELTAVLEISRWVEDRSYNCILVDTAPTGHTLRLLSMPELIRKWLGALDTLLAKHRYMRKLFSGSCHRDELDRFIEELMLSVRRLESLLGDPARSRFVPVMLAEALSVDETMMLVDELARLKIPVIDIVVNKLYPEDACALCTDSRRRQFEELRVFLGKTDPSRFSLWGVPLYPVEVRGAEPLSRFWQGVEEIAERVPFASTERVELSSRVEVPAQYPSTDIKLLLFAGKGGVGKTTLACATALRLARDFPGKEVFLFSTDPAHSLTARVGARVGPKPVVLTAGLTAMEIDAQAEFDKLKAEYGEDVERFLSALPKNLDLKFDREVMEKILDLSPPGLDEIMALTLAMELLAQDRYHVFVLDCSPTGHLIRLLELPELIDKWLNVFFALFLKYRRVFRLPKVAQRLVQMSKDLRSLRALLNDPARSALYAVAVLTEMAFQETKDLMAACDRMGIRAPLLLLNMATRAGDCYLCSAVSERESRVRQAFQQAFSGTHQTLIYRQTEPRGLEGLAGLGAALYQPMSRDQVLEERRKTILKAADPLHLGPGALDV